MKQSSQNLDVAPSSKPLSYGVNNLPFKTVDEANEAITKPVAKSAEEERFDKWLASLESPETAKNTTRNVTEETIENVNLSRKSEKFLSVFKDAKERAKKFINEAFNNNGQTNADRNQIKLFPVPDEMAEMVKSASDGSIDISNKEFALEGGKIYHELLNHGNEKIELSRDQLPLTVDDIEKAIDGMVNPDIVENVSTGLKSEQRQTFAFVKENDGYIVVVEAVGGKRNPNIVPEQIIKCTPHKMEQILSGEKSLSDVVYENSKNRINDLESNSLDIKNRVTVAPQSNAAALTQGSTPEAFPRSPLFSDSISPSQKNINGDDLSFSVNGQQGVPRGNSKVMAEDTGLGTEIPRLRPEEAVSNSNEMTFNVGRNADGSTEIGMKESRVKGNTMANSGIDDKDSLRTLYPDQYKYAVSPEVESLDKASMNLKDMQACEARYLDDAIRNENGDAVDCDTMMGCTKSISMSEMQLCRQVIRSFPKALDKEDWWGLKAKYADSLSRYLKANGADDSIFKSTTKEDIRLLEDAQSYAIEEAKKATFHQASDVAQALSDFSRTMANKGTVSGKVISGAVESVVPFKKTPVNILKSAAAYSPLETAKIVTDGYIRSAYTCAGDFYSIMESFP